MEGRLRSASTRITREPESASDSARFNPIVDLPSAGIDELMVHMAHDKKVADGKLTFILVKGIGRAFITRDVPADAVRDILAG